MKSKLVFAVLTALLILSLAVPALAGGWAAITLENLPAQIVVGEAVPVSFAVRQHGKTLLEDLEPTILTKNNATAETFQVPVAALEGKPGYYTASLKFPTTGTWEWTIQAFNMNQRMPDLRVTDSLLAASAPVQKAPDSTRMVIVIGLVIAAGATWLAVRSKQSWALAVIVLGLLVSGAGFASAAGKEKKGAIPEPAIASADADTGAALFVAKGCVTCHTNTRIDSKYYDIHVDMGPNLSRYLADADYLRNVLKDPLSVRPNAQMPNLELKEAEIEALIAFLNSGSDAINAPLPATAQPEQKIVTATPGLGVSDGSQPSQVNSTDCSNLDSEHGLLVQSFDDEESSQLSLIDPANGAPLCAYQPIKLGYTAPLTYSQDRLKAAIVSATDASQKNWRLFWIDLLAWKAMDTGISIPTWALGAAISPDNSRVAIVHSLLTESAEPQLNGHQIVVVDVSNQSIVATRELDISPRVVEFSSDGNTLVLYGAPYDYMAHTYTTPAKVEILDAGDLSLDWQAELPGVQEGIFASGDTADLSQMTQWNPALALSPARDTLFIVHADADRLTTIDLEARAFSTKDIQPKLSLLDQFLRSTASMAHAKVINGTTKTAVLSPDGSRLYVSGFTNTPRQDDAGNWMFDTAPFGLQVIDTESATEIARLDIQAQEVSLSPDGAILFARGWSDNDSWTEILDPNSLELVARLDEQQIYPAQTLAGDTLVLSMAIGRSAQQIKILDSLNFSTVSSVNGGGSWLDAP